MEEKAKQIQDGFLKKVKSTLGKNVSFVDELADLLGVSNDSAYRRLRCETPLSIDEIASICSYFKVPFDANTQPDSETVLFNYIKLENKKENFKKWLRILSENVNRISAVEGSTILYAADDVPVWHHFVNDEFICFKLFYWSKSILNDVDFEDKNFDMDMIDDELISMSKQLLKNYNKVNSTEIWNEDTLNSTLKQIEYFWESGYFKDKEQALRMCDHVTEIVNTLKRKAEKNSKLIGKEENGAENFALYRSEVMIGNNSILATFGENRIAYVSNNTFNFLSTTNIQLVNENEAWIKNLVRKSILISGVSEKQRNQFFKILYDKIEILKASIK